MASESATAAVTDNSTNEAQATAGVMDEAFPPTPPPGIAVGTVPVVYARGVSKRYGQQWALRDMDLTVWPGEVFGFLGPNGAGKTTLIRILLGLAAPTAGDVRLFGDDLFLHRNRIMRHVGAVVEAPVFFDYMSAWDNLRHLVSLSGPVSKDNLRATLRTVGLEEAMHKRVGAFSYGMKQRLGIAQALLPESRFLILDEPTNGLDPHGIAGVRDLVRRLARERGLTVLVSSHMLTEMEQICDRVAIINRGSKVLESRVDELRRQTAGDLSVRIHPTAAQVTMVDFPRVLPASAPPPDAIAIDPDSGHPILRYTAFPATEIPDLVRRLVAAGLEIESVIPHARTLEDIFLACTGDPNDVRVDSFRA